MNNKKQDFSFAHTFLSSLSNVHLNFGPVGENQRHPFIQVYIHNIFKELQQWPSFSKHQFYIIGANHPWNFELNKESIVVYLSNENHTIPKQVLKSKAVFTPYPPKNYRALKNVFPIPLGYNGSLEELPIKPILKRKIDYFFSGNLHKKRLPFYVSIKWHWVLKNLGLTSKYNSKVLFSNGFGKGLAPSEYATILMDSKIALVPPGYLSDISFRFFEAAKYGCIIITTKLHDYWFFKNFPVCEINSWSDLNTTINQIFSNPEKMKKNHKKTLQHYENYCSEKAVASYMTKAIATKIASI